jgi:hypothetical protein
MATPKTAVIEQIFRARFTPETGELTNERVTLADVAEAIEKYNTENPEKTLSAKNPANFFKDFVRNRESADRNWPAYALTNGYTGRQLTGSGACFEFVRLPPGQTTAFPSASFASPTLETPRHAIESVSLPIASRRLGREDEPWLIQVIVRLRIVEAHFALVSPRKIRQIDLLQMNVKLAQTEIDALFLGQEETSPGRFQEVIITCEAKRGRDDILESQILQQAKAPFSMSQIQQDHVVPLAVKSVGPSQAYVVEFEELDRATSFSATSLTVASDSLFEIRPRVPGVR